VLSDGVAAEVTATAALTMLINDWRGVATGAGGVGMDRAGVREDEKWMEGMVSARVSVSVREGRVWVLGICWVREYDQDPRMWGIHNAMLDGKNGIGVGDYDFKSITASYEWTLRLQLKEIHDDLLIW
jgi:hypothetical protein